VRPSGSRRSLPPSNHGNARRMTLIPSGHVDIPTYQVLTSVNAARRVSKISRLSSTTYGIQPRALHASKCFGTASSSTVRPVLAHALPCMVQLPPLTSNSLFLPRHSYLLCSASCSRVTLYQERGRAMVQGLPWPPGSKPLVRDGHADEFFCGRFGTST
jgi:hypothetical protein